MLRIRVAARGARDDVIVFSPDFRDALLKVSAQGGTAAPATVLDKEKHTTHRWPWFLPDGKHFIFLATSHTAGNPEYDGIYFGSVDSTQSHMVVASDSGRNTRQAICFIMRTGRWWRSHSI